MKNLLCISLFLFGWSGTLWSDVSAQPDTLGTSTDTSDRNVPDHPRLLLLKSDEIALRQRVEADSVWRGVHRAILGECDQMVSLPPLQRIQIGRRLLDKSREALRRVFFLSYAYRTTLNRTYLARAKQELLAVAAFSDWNPSHFLDVGEMTMAVAIGLDWLYADLPETTRATLREAIIRKGLEPSLRPEYSSWLGKNNNWNQVCNAGMAFGALAVYEHQPTLARQLINRAIRTVPTAMAEYAPNGAYPEGYNYWGYGTMFNVLLISALEKAYGTDFGLSKQPGFLQTADFIVHMAGPTGQVFNFADARAATEVQPALFWFAARRRDPSLLWSEQNQLTDTKQLLRERILPAMLVWGSQLVLNRANVPTQTFWAGGRTNPVAMFRSSWTDPQAVFVGLKAGTPSANHAHMDVGSFVMEANGVRWAMDFGWQEYESLESKGVQIWKMTQNSQRWDVFRYTNFVHNTLTVSGKLQQVKGHAAIVGQGNTPAFQYAITDLTSLYSEQLTSARRGVALPEGRYVVVRDELETATQPATIRWTMLTPATVTLTGPNTALLTKDGQTLTLRVTEPARITMKTWPTTPPHDYDAPNPGTALVGFEVELPANTKAALSVLLVPQGVTNARPTPALATW
jgi:hypothetical protein